MHTHGPSAVDFHDVYHAGQIRLLRRLQRVFTMESE